MRSAPVTVVEFDFVSRRERQIDAAEAIDSCRLGRSCWIDVDLDKATDTADILASLGINRIAINAAIADSTSGRCDIYEECFHLAVSAPTLIDGKLGFTYVDIILGERFIVTLRKGNVGFIDQTCLDYPAFFARHAESLGFVLFELWDNLIETYRRVLLRLEDEVEAVQAEILGDIDDAIFNRVGEVTHYLLLLRKNVLADREVLEQIALRKSAFVSPTAQPYLANMVGTLERLGNDLTTEREILNELLSLYLGIVSHRTNRVVNRLTVISVIFLPLSFLVGVYGMNFQGIPELEWSFGYGYFWALAIGITSTLLGLMKWKRWL